MIASTLWNAFVAGFVGGIIVIALLGAWRS